MHNFLQFFLLQLSTCDNPSERILPAVGSSMPNTLRLLRKSRKSARHVWQVAGVDRQRDAGAAYTVNIRHLTLRLPSAGDPAKKSL